MSNVRGFLAVALIAVLIVALDGPVMVGTALGASPSPAEIAAHRRQILDDMLTGKYEPALIAGLRRVCAIGEEPASVIESRGEGAYFTPDAADSCIAALTRTAHDGQLLVFYRSFMIELGGDVQAHAQLPRAIGAAVLADSTKVAIGNGRATVISPAVALDAGFTVAYQQGVGAKPPAADPRQLKPIGEACLSQHQDVGTCFSAGYVYGAQAFAAHDRSPG